jgi:CRP/FNR family cyclic AMP-dependent transcriptional regulator
MLQASAEEGLCGEQTLANINLFRDLSPDLVAQLSRRCRWKRYNAKEQIIGENDDSHGVYFVVQGSVRVNYYAISGQEVIFQDRGKGDLFGELATIDGKTRSANVVSVERSLIAFMPALDFLQLLRSNNDLQAVMLLRLSEMVRMLSQRIIEISTLPVRLRIRSQLLRLSQRGTSSDKGISIIPAPTHAEIATLVGTHREAVTRELNDLARLGVIKKGRGMLLITDVERLSALFAAECQLF